MAHADKVGTSEAPSLKPPKKRTHTAAQAEDDEDKHQSDSGETPPPKRVRRKNKSTRGTLPIDNDQALASSPKSKVHLYNIAGQSEVIEHEVVKPEVGKKTFALKLFYGETASKQRHAKRILCIRSTVGPNHVIVPKESKS